MKIISSVDVRDIAEILEEYISEGQPRMAQVIRSVLIDVFKEAQHFGEVPPGYNPALATKQPRHHITRQRLNLEEWQRIFNIADTNHHLLSDFTRLRGSILKSCSDINRQIRQPVIMTIGVKDGLLLRSELREF